MSLSWSRGQSQYKGYPLYVRRPDYPDVYSYKRQFPVLFYVTHILDKVGPSGQPDPAYNDTLAEFDLAMCRLVEMEDGIIAFVATYGGKRHYYYYVKTGFDHLQALNRASAQFPQHRLENFIREDKKWTFLRKYPVKVY